MFYRIALIAFLLLLTGSHFSVAQEAPAADEPKPAESAEAPAVRVRDQIPRIDHETFEAARLKGVAEIDAINDELNASYGKDDFEGLDKIVQRYRDKPYTLVWGKSALSHVYGWLGSLAPDQTGEEHEAWLKKWAEARPTSATPRVLLGDRYIHFAWDARGSGFAGTVTQEGWKLFHERLVQANAYLDEALKLEHPDPELYCLKIRIARALTGSKTDAEAALAAGIKLDPSYHPLYEEMAVFLMPRWQGAPGDLEQFAENLSASLGPELASEMYMRVALSQIFYYRATFFEATTFDFERILAGFQAFSKKYSSHVEYQNKLAYLACVERDRALAERLLAPLNPDQMNEGVWGNAELAECWRKWIVTKHESHGELQMFAADRVPLRYLVYLADNQRLAVFGNTNSDPLFLWNADTGEMLSRMRPPGEPTWTLDITANRRYAIVGGGSDREGSDRLMVYHLEEGRLMRTSSAPSGSVRSLAISQKGDEIAALQTDQVITLWSPKDLDEEKGTIQVFDSARDKELIDRLEANPAELYNISLAYSGDDTKLFAIVGDRELRVFDVESGKIIHRWCEEHGRPLEASGVNRSRNGKLMAITYQADPPRPMEIIDAVSLEPVTEIKHDAKVIYGFDFDDAGERIALGGEGSGLTLWDVKTGALLHRFELAPTDTVTCVSFSPDGNRLAVGVAAHPFDGAVFVWDVSKYRPKAP